MDRVRVVEAGDQQPPLQPADQLLERRVARGHHHVGRERPVGVRRRQAVAGGPAPHAGGGLGVEREVPAHAGVEQRQALLGHALRIEAHRQPGRVAAVVGDRDQRRCHPLAGLVERAVLLHREGREAEVAEHVQQVHHGVVMEHHRVVTGLDDDRAPARPRPLRRLAPHGGGVDRGRIHRALLGVAGPVIGAHRHREQLARGPSLGGADPLRAGHRDRLGVRGERAEGGDPGLVRGGDDGPRPAGPELRGRGGRPVRPGGLERLRRVRLGQARPVLELLDVGGDVAGPLHERANPLVVGAPGGGDAHPPAAHEAQVDEHLRAGDVLVDLGVGEPRERRLTGHDQRLRLRGARPFRQRGDALGEPERLGGIAADAVSLAHAITPTRTLRNRAPETPWPTWPVWPGSPLPQLGVPHMRHDEASPTASIERHSS